MQQLFRLLLINFLLLNLLCDFETDSQYFIGVFQSTDDLNAGVFAACEELSVA